APGQSVPFQAMEPAPGHHKRRGGMRTYLAVVCSIHPAPTQAKPGLEPGRLQGKVSRRKRLAVQSAFCSLVFALGRNLPMRRTFVAVSVAGAIALAGLVILLRPGPSPAKPDKDGSEPAVVKPAAQLPIGNVILYSSGVGYFQREGKVTGNTRVDLSFPASDIN